MSSNNSVAQAGVGRHSIRLGAALALLLSTSPLLPSTALASDRLFIYPARNQSEDQQVKDRYECYLQAKAHAGIDPHYAQQPPAKREVRARVGRNENEGAQAAGTAIGAVAGGVIGAHDHSGVEGAIVGAVVGTILGGAVEASGQQKAEQEAQARAAQKADEQQRQRSEFDSRMADYNNAFSACLQGRGYTVK